MKNTYLFRCMLVALLALSFTACDNEPLQGEFVTEGEGEVTAEVGQFVATVGTIGFEAQTTLNQYNPTTDVMVLTGIKANQETIALSFASPNVGTFDITNTGGLNGATYFKAEDILNPYISVGATGGAGQLVVTAYDTDAQTITGTFSFTAVRIALDDDGTPVLDNSGNPILETITISQGSFNAVEYVVDGTTGDGGDGDPVIVIPEDEFFVNVDGVEFVDTELTTTETTVGGVMMLNVVATNEAGAKVRIDFPADTGVGTFDFVSVSDGSEITAVYSDGLGNDNLTPNSAGILTITEFGGSTGRISATFQFIGTNPDTTAGDPRSIDFAQGSFTVDYIDNTGGISDTLTAEIDGVTYNASSFEYVEETLGDNTILTIITQDAILNQSVSLAFAVDTSAGTYNLVPVMVDGTEVVGLMNPDVGNSISFTSETGVLTIISYQMFDGVMEGTFSFTATDPAGNDTTVYAVTNGSFVLDVMP